MRQAIHPEARLVIFEDAQTKAQYLIESTITTDKMSVFTEDGIEYPFVSVDVSADSHPFYTGTQTYAQATGQIEKFNRKYNK